VIIVSLDRDASKSTAEIGKQGKNVDEEHTGRAGPSPRILFAGVFHNIVDGRVITVTFLAFMPSGVSTVLAVVARDVPQEAKTCRKDSPEAALNMAHEKLLAES
jgi:zinc transporter ZupT